MDANTNPMQDTIQICRRSIFPEDGGRLVERLIKVNNAVNSNAILPGYTSGGTRKLKKGIFLRPKHDKSMCFFLITLAKKYQQEGLMANNVKP